MLVFRTMDTSPTTPGTHTVTGTPRKSYRRWNITEIIPSLEHHGTDTVTGTPRNSYRHRNITEIISSLEHHGTHTVT